MPIKRSRPGFKGKVLKHRGHKTWWLRHAPRESVRGAIRGAAARERLLHPSPAKAVQRLRRRRLLAAYELRFGQDEFWMRLGGKRLTSFGRRKWLPGGYAMWRDRLAGSTSPS